MKKSIRHLGLITLAVAVAACATVYAISGVRVQAALGTESGCSPSSPIAISVSNHTLSRVSSVIVSLEGWRNGDSTNILSGRRYLFSSVLLPLETKSACYSDSAFAVSKPASVKVAAQQGYETVSLSDAINEVVQARTLIKNVELVVTGVEVIRK
ncbi:hypothetical protein PsyrB_12260 [Pseudomonas syringae pv. syringae B301D]|nr:hypothetical protein PsyrB_12260 [Pseudomonas syringae pv. syringae B301D]